MVILAHRGSVTENMHENTISAFQRAMDLGADGVETDVRLTKDSKLILFHDNSIGKRHIRNLTHKQICQRIGYEVPTLSDLLNWSHKDFILNLEIKDHDIIPQMYEELQRYKKQECIISSFHHPSAFKLSKALSIPAGLLMPIRPVFIKPFLQLVPAVLDYIIWNYDIYSPELKVELLDYKHLVYNINEIRPTRKEFIDGIISDHLDIHIKKSKLTTADDTLK